MNKVAFLTSVYLLFVFIFSIVSWQFMLKSYEKRPECATLGKTVRNGREIQSSGFVDKACGDTLYYSVLLAALASIPLTFVVYKFKDKI